MKKFLAFSLCLLLLLPLFACSAGSGAQALAAAAKATREAGSFVFRFEHAYTALLELTGEPVQTELLDKTSLSIAGLPDAVRASGVSARLASGVSLSETSLYIADGFAYSRTVDEDSTLTGKEALGEDFTGSTPLYLALYPLSLAAGDAFAGRKISLSKDGNLSYYSVALLLSELQSLQRSRLGFAQDGETGLTLTYTVENGRVVEAAVSGERGGQSVSYRFRYAAIGETVSITPFEGWADIS